jgi:hypothetical protein
MSTNDRRAVLSRAARTFLFVLAASATSSLTVTAKANAPTTSPMPDAGINSTRNPASAQRPDLRAEVKCEAPQTAGCPPSATGAVEDGAPSKKIKPVEETGADTTTNAGERKNENERITTTRSLGAMFREKLETIIAWSITLLAIAVSGFLVRQQRSSDRMVLSLKTQIASLTEKASVPLEALDTAQASPENTLAVKGMPAAQNQGADRLQAPGNGTVSRAPSEPLHRLSEAGRAIAAEALTCFAELESDKTFAKLNEVGKLRDAVTSADAKFKRLCEGDLTPDDDPVRIALSGGFNDILTLSSLIEVYFSDQDDWYEMCRVMSALEEFTRLLLARYGVEVYVVKPLTRLFPYRGDKETEDIRGIKKLDAVRAAVGKQAATINQGEALIVDCLAPGFIIRGAGSTPPRMCFYNPSAWT